MNPFLEKENKTNQLTLQNMFGSKKKLLLFRKSKNINK